MTFYKNDQALLYSHPLAIVILTVRLTDKVQLYDIDFLDVT